MAYCGPRGIELDAFLRWSRRSQEAALAWSAYESRRCKSCGSHPEDWAEDKFAHHAHASQCPGCQQTQRLAEALREEEQRGVTVGLANGPAASCPQCRPNDN